MEGYGESEVKTMNSESVFHGLSQITEETAGKIVRFD